MWLETSVRKVDDATFVHTTAVRWLGVTLMSSVEELALAHDGRSFELRGTQRVAPALWRSVPVSGHGQVDAAGERATYTIEWLGVELRQDTHRTGDRVSLHQRGAGFAGVQALRRVRSEP